MSTELIELENQINRFVFYRITKHFCEEEEDIGGLDGYWVAGEVGHCIYINDLFFSLGDMMEYEKYGYTTDEIFEHYYTMLDKEDIKMNIKTYKKLVLGSDGVDQGKVIQGE